MEMGNTPPLHCELEQSFHQSSYMRHCKVFVSLCLKTLGLPLELYFTPSVEDFNYEDASRHKRFSVDGATLASLPRAF